MRLFAAVLLPMLMLGACGSEVQPVTPVIAAATPSPATATVAPATPTADEEYFISDVAFRVTCDDGMESHIVPGSYTKAEAIDTFCFGLGSAADTPGLYGVTCLDDFALEYFASSDRDATARNFCR